MALQVLLQTTCGEALSQPRIELNAAINATEPPRPEASQRSHVSRQARSSVRLDPPGSLPETLESQPGGELHHPAVRLTCPAAE
jgi:hypothetical protein